MRKIKSDNGKLIFVNREIMDLPQGIADEPHLSVLKCRSGRVTITPLMKEVLLRASEPHSVEELAHWVAEKNGVMAQDVYPSVRNFASRMLKLGVLVHEGVMQDNSDLLTERLEIEKRFGNFTLHLRVAKNSKATLYQCSRIGNDKIFLIKILIDPSEKDSITKEHNILNSLPPHPNVRKCYEISEVEGIPYLLLEYIDGKSLSKIVTESSLGTKLVIGRKMMKALNHLHRHKVLHGDIHASNFIFTPPDQIHLVDLGMAYYESEQDTNHGGVANYMAPERMPDDNLKFSKKRGDYVSEVFQLGICLYYLLSGDYPFNGTLLKQLAHAIKHETPAPLNETSYGERIPEEISKVVFKALEKRPEERYQRVVEMLTDWNKAITPLRKKLEINMQ